MIRDDEKTHCEQRITMKTIVLLGGYGTRMRPHTWSRAKPLLRVAGNSIIGHLLDLMKDVTNGQVIFVVGYLGDQIEAWLRKQYGHLDLHFVVQEQALGQAHALWLCRDYLQDDEDVMIAFGDGIVKADYAGLDRSADAVFYVKEVEDPRTFGVVVLNEAGFVTSFVEKPKTMENRLAIAGVYWFKSGRKLRDAVDTVINTGRKTLGEYYLADAFQVMLEQGDKIRVDTVEQWEDAGKPDTILHTNRRLLSVGYATFEAIERGYGEGFIVIPPVFLHPDADIETSVIGPYASIEANAVIRNAVVRDSIIDEGAQIEDCIIENSLIGEKAQVKGRGRELFIGDNAIVHLG